MYTKEFTININRKDSVNVDNLKQNRISMLINNLLTLMMLILLLAGTIIGVITLINKDIQYRREQILKERANNIATITVDNIKNTSDLIIDYTKDEFETQLGREFIELNSCRLLNYELPNTYYGDYIDFSSFQPYMGYKKITNTAAPAYSIVNDENCYTDEYGLRRFKTNDNQFTIDGQDDYVVAMGTFYKDKGTVGTRYLVVTTAGRFTIITGDEKDDRHTDEMNMFTRHGNNKVAIIEWIVDEDNLNPEIKKHGTVTKGGPEVVKGEILYIYEIKE